MLSSFIGSLFFGLERRQLRGKLRGPLFRSFGCQARGPLSGLMLRLFGCALRGLLCRSLFRRFKRLFCSLLGRLILCCLSRPLCGLLRRSLFRRLSGQLRGLHGCLLLRRACRRLLRGVFRSPLRGHLRRQYCRLPRGLLRFPLRLAFGRGGPLRLRRHRQLSGRAPPLQFRFAGFLHPQPGIFPDLRSRSREIPVFCAMQIRPGIEGCDVVRSSVLITLPCVIRHWTPFGLPALPISDPESIRLGALK